MLGATTTILDNITGDCREQCSTTLLPSQNFLCTSCQISFTTSDDQRAHMKAPWHLHNLKRRMEQLPPIALDDFDGEDGVAMIKHKSAKKTTDSSKSIDHGRRNSASKDKHLDDISVESASPFQCLFCSHEFAVSDIGSEENLSHMSSVHGLEIPNQAMVSDLQSFLGYLATEVRQWHECLYCGATKNSTTSIQSHMRDKGHCLLKLHDFWECPLSATTNNTSILEREHSTKLSTTEMRFPSGKVVSSKHTAFASAKVTRHREFDTLVLKGPVTKDEIASVASSSLAVQLRGKHITHREEMGIQGISTQQRQAIVLAEKKAQRGEARARRAREWVYAKNSNSQKFDQLDNQGKWGKQNHKLLPR